MYIRAIIDLWIDYREKCLDLVKAGMEHGKREVIVLRRQHGQLKHIKFSHSKICSKLCISELLLIYGLITEKKVLIWQKQAKNLVNGRLVLQAHQYGQ